MDDIFRRQEDMLFVSLRSVLEPVVTWMAREEGVPHRAAPFINLHAHSPFVPIGEGWALVLLIQVISLKHLERQWHSTATERPTHDPEQSLT